MSSWRLTGWCVRCNADRPFVRAKGARRCIVCLEPVAPAPSKYKNVPTVSKHTGRLFQSKKEARREPSLLGELNAGHITDLQYQVPFRLELFSTQAVEALLDYMDGEEWDHERLMGLVRDVRRSRQCICKYVADFTYLRDGRLVVEDPKGYRKPEYRIKKKLMVLAHNIEIQEPGDGGVQMRARGAGIRGRGTGSRFMGGA